MTRKIHDIHRCERNESTIEIKADKWKLNMDSNKNNNQNKLDFAFEMNYLLKMLFHPNSAVSLAIFHV